MKKQKIVKIHLISNGFGEDLIAAHLAVAFREAVPTARIVVTPLVGEGGGYVKAGFTPSMTNPMLPSGGFLRRFWDVVSDGLNGLFGQVFRQMCHVKQLSLDVDLRICVGDVFCLWVGCRGRRVKTVFLPTAKSDRFMAHSWGEYWLIKRLATIVFTRDEETRRGVHRQGIEALFLGNPMMDGLIPTPQTKWEFEGVVSGDQTPAVVTILPGSRDEAYENMTYLFWLFLGWKVPVSPVVGIVAKGNLSLDILIQQAVNFGWELVGEGVLKSPKNGMVIELTSKFVDAVCASRVVVGLAGTANEQAVFLNRPVVCFPGFGPQSTEKRFREQRALLGPRLHVVPVRHEGAIFEVLNPLVVDDSAGPIPEPQYSAREIMSHLIAGDRS